MVCSKSHGSTLEGHLLNLDIKALALRSRWHYTVGLLWRLCKLYTIYRWQGGRKSGTKIKFSFWLPRDSHFFSWSAIYLPAKTTLAAFSQIRCLFLICRKAPRGFMWLLIAREGCSRQMDHYVQKHGEGRKPLAGI